MDTTNTVSSLDRSCSGEHPAGSENLEEKESVLSDEELTKRGGELCCNITDISGMAGQARLIADEEQHKRTMGIILESNLPVQEKLDLIHKEEDRWDARIGMSVERAIRIQSAQADNAAKASTIWLKQEFLYGVATFTRFLSSEIGHEFVRGLVKWRTCRLCRKAPRERSTWSMISVRST